MSSVALTVSTKFTAQDRYSSVINKMQAGTMRFAKSASAGISMVRREERKLRNGFSKLTGQLGKLGLAFGSLMIVQEVIKANIELDSSLASLQAITGVTNEQFKAFSKQVGDVAKAQKMFAGDTAKAFEIVASAQPILLENADAMALVTNAVITLSKASGDDLETSALSLTGVMNQFNLQASEAARVMNTLAAGSVYGSANISNVAASMKNFGTVAASSNMTVEETVALIEVMGSKSIFAEEAGTKLRSALISMQDAGMGYASGVFNINDALSEMKKKLDAQSTAQQKDILLLKVFGKEQITTGRIMMSNIGLFQDLTKQVTGTQMAVEQMNTNSNTLRARLDQVKNSFLNVMTTTDSTNESMQKIKDMLLKVADNMDKIIPKVWLAIKVFAAYKIIMMIATAVQWAFNIAAMANPIGLIIIAIVALIAAIAILIIKWKDIVEWIKTSDNWFARLIRFALIPIVTLFQTIKAVWEKLKAAFKVGGIGGIFKAIGKSILSWVLMPLETVLKLVNKLTGGKIGGELLEKVGGFRESLTALTPEEQKALNAEAEVEKVRTERSEKTTNNNVQIDVESKANTKASISKNTGANVKLTNTVGWMQ